MGALSLSPELLKGAVLLNTGFNAPKANADLSPAHALVKTPVIGELLLEVIFSIFERLKSVKEILIHGPQKLLNFMEGLFMKVEILRHLLQ
jgi:hypothetical protein